MDKILHNTDAVWGQPALIWASLTLAVMTLPVVIVATEESLKAIPPGLREASLALGATKLETILKIVLPQALPGIMTGGILAISRAAKVAPILFTGVAYYMASLPGHLSDQFMDLGYHVFVLSTQSPNIDQTQADPLRDGAGAVDADVRAEHRRHSHPRACNAFEGDALNFVMAEISLPRIETQIVPTAADMNAVHRDRRRVALLWREQGAEEYFAEPWRESCDGVHRAERLRQIYFAPLPEPHERFD